MISNYTVEGMSCDHCVRAVTEEVSALPGVSKAEVALAGKSLTVTSDEPVDFAAIKEAVAEAGDYSVSAA